MNIRFNFFQKTKLLLLGLLAVYSFGCCKSGENPRMEKLQQASQILIDALENYRKENGKYTEHLNELQPKYMEKTLGEIYPDLEKQGVGSFRPFLEEDRYELQWTTGANCLGYDECIYYSDKKQWKCQGYH